MTTLRITIDPVACDAYGFCAELVPEAIVLDEWGYPMVDGKPLPPNWWHKPHVRCATAPGGPSCCAKGSPRPDPRDVIISSAHARANRAVRR